VNPKAKGHSSSYITHEFDEPIDQSPSMNTVKSRINAGVPRDYLCKALKAQKGRHKNIIIITDNNRMKSRSEKKTILNRPPLHYTQCRDEEYVVFGFLRQTMISNTLLDVNIMKLCLKYFYCVDFWCREMTDKRLTINTEKSSIWYKPSEAAYDYINAFCSDCITFKEQRTWKLQIFNIDPSCALKVIIGICEVERLPVFGEFTNAKNNGYGLCEDGYLYHAATLSGDKFLDRKLKNKDVIIMHLDMLHGTLSYNVNNECMRVAFEDIDVLQNYCLSASMCSPSTKIKLLRRK